MKPFLVCGWSLALAGSALAVSPKLNSTTPSGGQRGTDLELRFNGQRLSDTKEIIFYYPGIEAVNMEEPRSNSVKATIRIAKDCRLGEHLVRLRTATGVSDVRTFYVGPYPTLAEVEPNELNKPQSIPMNSTVSGVGQSSQYWLGTFGPTPPDVTAPFRLAFYGYKRFKDRPVCAPDLVELPAIPGPKRVL